MILTPRNFRLNKIEHIKRVLLGKSIITRGTKISTSSLNSLKMPNTSVVISQKPGISAIPPTLTSTSSSFSNVTTPVVSSEKSGIIASPLNNMPVVGGFLGKFATISSKYPKIDNTLSKTVIDYPEYSLPKPTISLIVDDYENPSKMVVNNNFSTISEVSLKTKSEIALGNFRFKLTPENVITSLKYPPTSAMCYDLLNSMVIIAGRNVGSSQRHLNLGWIDRNLSDGSLMFHGIVLTLKL